VTDIRFAKAGKVRQDKLKPKFRRGCRDAMRRCGRAAQMVLKGRLKLEMVAEMHSACVEDNQTEKGVVKAFRMGGWLNARPTKAGLEPLDGAVWDFFL
jgi:hypothetical protein